MTRDPLWPAENLAAIERFGFVPNYIGPKALCASRSQPPFLTWAIGELWPSPRLPSA